MLSRTLIVATAFATMFVAATALALGLTYALAGWPDPIAVLLVMGAGVLGSIITAVLDVRWRMRHVE